VRVLVVHNRYSASTPSGENVSVDLEVEGLCAAGVEVHRHEVSNDDVLSGGVVDKLRAAAATTWSPGAAARLDAEIDRIRPDIVHVHNLFPLLTASVPARALARGLPVVWTARNLRVTCVEGTQFRAGTDCRLCRPGWRVPGVRHRCYRGSLGASVLVTGATSLFRRIARTRLTTVAISHAMARWLVDEAGFDPARVHVKYNAVAIPTDVSAPAPGTRDTFLFVGKFAAYKGIDLLLDAWSRVEATNARLRFVGDGPMAETVRAATGDPRVTWTGHVQAAEVLREIAAARAVVVPSVWDEPFGRVVAEAFAMGRPAITTGRGALAEVVDRAGWVTSTDADDLARAIDEAAASDALVDERGAAGRARHQAEFSLDATISRLLGIYDAALGEAAGQTRRPVH
jgi:glycosyltransferase involved in cell wall biosynthesis